MDKLLIYCLRMVLLQMNKSVHKVFNGFLNAVTDNIVQDTNAVVNYTTEE